MPGLLSSPVCLTVIWFLSWSLQPICAQIWTDEVSGVQYGRLDSNVTLSCGKSQIRLPVAWRLNNSTVLPWHKVTPDGRLVLLRVDQSAQGDYSCYDSRGLLLHTVTLRLGRPPGLLSISCRVPNHTYVGCSWMNSVKTLLPAKYNASLRNNKEWWPCTVDVGRKHCEVAQPAFWQSIHTLSITETNVLGSETTKSILKLSDLLKPDPPESVQVKELEGFPMRLVVSWKFPSTWQPQVAFPLLFHIRYRPLGSALWSEVFSEESPVVLCDALAGHLHQVEVRARDEVNSESQWSNWTLSPLIKPWEVHATTTNPVEGPDDDDDDFFNTKPETSTAKSYNSIHEEEGNLGLVILLVLFSVVIITTVLSLICVMWVKQRRRDQATKQELTSMVKMKSMPI